jgi:hypothetical protein
MPYTNSSPITLNAMCSHDECYCEHLNNDEEECISSTILVLIQCLQCAMHEHLNGVLASRGLFSADKGPSRLAHTTPG